MKKLFLFFAVIGVLLGLSQPISADTYYLRGGFDWTTGTELVHEGGTSTKYSCIQTVSDNCLFKLYNATRSKWWGYGDSDGAWTVSTVPSTQQLWCDINNDSGANCKITTGGTYKFTFDTSGNNMTVSSAASFVLNSTTQPKLRGESYNSTNGWSWGSDTSFEKSSTDPLSYTLTFTAGGATVYLGLFDSEGSSFKPANLDWNGTKSTTEFEQSDIAWNVNGSISNLTSGTQYVLTLAQDGDDVRFSISEADMTPATPTITVSGNKVKFECTTTGATIHYTITAADGTATTGTGTSGTEVDLPKKSGGITIEAYATVSGSDLQSETATETGVTYFVNAPTFSRTSATSNTVTITASGVDYIYYSLDGGSTWTPSGGTRATVDLTAASTTIKAYGKVGEAESAVETSSAYAYYVAAPEVNIDGEGKVTITVPDGTTVRYTTDGTTPTASSEEYPAGGFTLSGTATVTAVAFASNGASSSPASRTWPKVEAVTVTSVEVYDVTNGGQGVKRDSGFASKGNVWYGLVNNVGQFSNYGNETNRFYFKVTTSAGIKYAVGRSSATSSGYDNSLALNTEYTNSFYTDVHTDYYGFGLNKTGTGNYYFILTMNDDNTGVASIEISDEAPVKEISKVSVYNANNSGTYMAELTSADGVTYSGTVSTQKADNGKWTSRYYIKVDYTSGDPAYVYVGNYDTYWFTNLPAESTDMTTTTTSPFYNDGRNVKSFLVDDTAGDHTFTLTMNADGTAAKLVIAAGAAEPSKISKVSMYARGTGNSDSTAQYLGELAAKSDGVTFSGDIAVKKASADHKDTDRYYFIKVEYTEGSPRYVVLGTNDTWWITELGTDLTNVTTLTSEPPVGSCFLLDKDDGTYNFTLTMNAAGTQAVKLCASSTGNSGNEELDALDTVRWSLTDDKYLADGESAYFLLSDRMNDWRVSPEWQLNKQADGSYKLDNFMSVPGSWFRIRKITRHGSSLTYTDYGKGGNEADRRFDRASMGLGNLNDTYKGDDFENGAYSLNNSYEKSIGATATTDNYKLDLGYSMVSVTFRNDNELTLTLDLTKPSTLQGAPNPGMPYVAIVGSKLGLATGTGQNLTYIADGAHPQWANGYGAFDSKGNLFIYGAGTNGDAYNASGYTHRISEGMVVPNTIHPPRNMVKMKIDDTPLTSNKTIFKYQGPQQLSIPDKDNSPEKWYAVYTISDVEMQGNFKIWSGCGTVTYGGQPYGWSHYNNWGLTTAWAADTQEQTNSRQYTALSSAGPYIYNDNGVDRAGAEDNTAGSDFYFNDKTYVSTLYFYYALERDTYTQGTHNSSDGDALLWTNTGRNYSWMQADYTSSATKIVLTKYNRDNARIVYSINEAETGGDIINSYVVTLWSCDQNGDNRTPYKKASYEVTELPDGTTVVTPTTLLGEQVPDLNDLENGYYIASITAQVTADGDPDTRESFSDVIQVISANVKPQLTAAQVMEGDLYTFNIAVNGSLSAYMTNAGGTPVPPATVYAEVTFEKALAANQEIQVSKGTVTHDGDRHTISFPTGTFSSSVKTIPTITVTNCTPTDRYNFTITAHATDFQGNPQAYADATVIAPNGIYKGEAVFVKDASATYNYVLIDGYIDNPAVSQDVLDNFRLTYHLDYKEENVDLGDVSHVAGSSAASVDADLEYMPYTGNGGERGSQVYTILTSTTYTRDGETEGYTSDSVEETPITAKPGALNGPRENIQDLNADSYKEYGSKTTGNPQTVESDLRTLVDVHIEQYGGVHTIYEDAYIAALIEAPNPDLVAKFDVDDRPGTLGQRVNRIGHHTTDKYYDAATANPKSAHSRLRHKYGEDGTSIHAEAPGMTLVQTWNDVTDGSRNTVWWDVAQKEAPAGWQWATKARVDGVDYQANSPEEVDAYWAGCPTDVLTASQEAGQRYLTSGDADDKSVFDRADAMNSFYTNFNHHIRTGWTGGEMMSGNWFSFMVSSSVEGGEITGLNGNADNAGWPASASEAMDIHNRLEEMVAVNTDLSDIRKDEKGNIVGPVYGEIVLDKDRAKDMADFFIAQGRVMVRVPHVNHQSWFQPDITDPYKVWRNSANRAASDEEMANEFVKFPTQEYIPLQYSLQYDYPFLNTARYATVSSPESQMEMRGKARAQGVTPADDELTPVSAINTGVIPFDGAAAGGEGVPTSITEMTADAAGAAVGYLTIDFDSQTGMLTVRSSDEIGTIAVVSISGPVVSSTAVPASERTAVVDLSRLSGGAYVVTVNGRGGKKILK